MAGRTGMLVASSCTRTSIPRALLALAASVVLLAGCAAPPAPSRSLLPDTTPYPSGPAVDTTGSGGGAGPTADTGSGTGSTGGGPGASPSDEEVANSWASIPLADAAPVASLEPTVAGAAGVATTTAFRLTSLDGTDPVALAGRLRMEPVVALEVGAAQGDSVVVRPANPLRERTAYRLTLVRPDGTTAARWAAQTAGPLTILGTIPGDAATNVPTDAGIELQFDQAGVDTDDLAAHFRIRPSVNGGFVGDGRLVAFTPSANLAPATVYTVTVTAGLPLAGTGQRLERDLTFRFETARTHPKPMVVVSPTANLVEIGTGDRAAIGVSVDVPTDDEGEPLAKRPAKVAVTVHRLAGMSAGMNAWTAIVHGPSWAQLRTTPDVSTAGLPRVVNASLRLLGQEWQTWVQLPRRLSAGWYVVTVTVDGRPRQCVLQVTDLAVYAMAATDRTAVWVNDLRTTRPVAGAVVSVASARLGATGRDGLLLAATPDRVLALDDGRADPARESFLVVRSGGRSAFHPLRGEWVCEKCTAAPGGDPDAWWHLFSSDRSRYRSTDTVNAWGVVRTREADRVPASVTVELLAGTFGEVASPAIRTITAHPDSTGAYAVAVSFADLPSGPYRLRATVDGTQVDEAWFDVGVLRKPAYRLAMTIAHRAALSGTTMTTTVHAAFFEGTPVAGATLSFTTDDGAAVPATTDADGDTTARVPVAFGDGQWGLVQIDAHPSNPEEGDITAYQQLAVFKGTALVDADGVVDGRRLSITGKVSDVVLERFDAQPTVDVWQVDPRGKGRGGVTVVVQVLEHRTVRTGGQRVYDFITKRMVTEGGWSEQTRTILSRTVRTAADGTFRLSTTVAGTDRSYEIHATYRDEGGHLLLAETYASGAQDRGEDDWPRLTGPVSDDDTEGQAFSIGDTVRVRYEGGLDRPRVSRYLFTVTHQGLRNAVVTTSPVFRARFRSAMVPGFTIRGVRFTGYGYEVAGSYDARLRLADRRLRVTVTPDRSRYAPGATATLVVRTLDPDGRPVAATAFVQVSDEKLYAMGAAATADPLEALYGQVDDGVLLTIRSHHTPADDEGGKGDTGGGGEGGDTTGGRGDFRDWLLGRLVTTDATGTARVTVPLSDDLTSWRATAAAVDGALEAGVGEASLVVSIPFFAEATIAPQYLAADRPVIRVRGFGGGLVASDVVTFKVSSDTLPMDTVTATAAAFKAAEIPLAALSVGSHTVRIEATAGSGDTAVRDVLLRTFTVVASRSTRAETTWMPVTGSVAIPAGTGTTRLTVVDAGRGRVLPILEEFVAADGARGDQVIASGLAARVLKDAFGIERATAAGEDGLLPYLANENAVSLVPWGGGDTEATVLAALAGDPRLPAEAVRDGLRATLGTDEPDGPGVARPIRILALAGLAGLGDPVLADVRAAAALTDLTTGEQAMLAVAAFAAGDEDLARTLEHRLLAAHGRHQGPYSRVLPSKGEDGSVVTAWVAIVAASLGEPVAAELDAWVVDHPPATTLVDVQRALAARGWAARVPAAAAAGTLTVDGVARSIAVADGEAVSLDLTPAQAAGATLTTDTGSLLAVVTRDVPLQAGSLTAVPGLSLERSVSPSLGVDETSTVIVTLTASLTPSRTSTAGDCWDVRDLLPSGLAPIEGAPTWVDDESGESRLVGAGPDLVDGQRIAFSVTLDRLLPSRTVKYLARVVTPGTYAWEPAVIQSCRVPDQGLVTAPETLRIRGAAD